MFICLLPSLILEEVIHGDQVRTLLRQIATI